MSSTPRPGSDLPSSLGGPGFRAREGSLATDLGSVWTACGAGSHVAPLREILLAVPGREMQFAGEPSAWLMRDRPDAARLAAQARALGQAFSAEGVEVHWHDPLAATPRPTPNHIFVADLFFMTPEGAVISRMAAAQRAGEERAIAAALAARGIPILMTVRDCATFEGADAIWLDRTNVLVGVGRRTNRAGAAQLTRLLGDMGVTVQVCELGAGVQHLLGAFNPLDERLAAVLRPAVTDSLREALHGWELLELDLDEETGERRAMNFVTLAPRRVLMPSRCPRTREALEKRGVACCEADVSEYLKADGGIGCATGIVRRA
jgi:N-dimethylarginine dimethylaminohydrolase